MQKEKRKSGKPNIKIRLIFDESILKRREEVRLYLNLNLDILVMKSG